MRSNSRKLNLTVDSCSSPQFTIRALFTVDFPRFTQLQKSSRLHYSRPDVIIINIYISINSILHQLPDCRIFDIYSTVHFTYIHQQRFEHLVPCVRSDKLIPCDLSKYSIIYSNTNNTYSVSRNMSRCKKGYSSLLLRFL